MTVRVSNITDAILALVGSVTQHYQPLIRPQRQTIHSDNRTGIHRVIIDHAAAQQAIAADGSPGGP